MYLITNGQIITPVGILAGYEILIEHDRIKQIAKREAISRESFDVVIDANGGYITPGFVDIHTDYIEQIAAPRPRVLMDFDLALKETEKIVVNQGITTMFHSLSLYKGGEFGQKAIRMLENVDKFAKLIENTHTSQHLIRHRFHARLEIDNIEAVPYLKRYIEQKQVQLISFMDHTPGQGQYRDLEIYREAMKGHNHLTDEEVAQVMKNHETKERLTFKGLKEIADLAKASNVAVASHDDDELAKIDLVKHFHTSISEFPITIEVAQKAKASGLYTVAGAPNVLLGGSHSGNLSAIDAIKEEVIDILCSDYYPASLLHAVFKLHQQYGYDLAAMIKLVTINPAKAVGMAQEIGSIEAGKKADLLIIEQVEGDYPVITHTFVDGKLLTQMNYRNSKVSERI